MRRLELHARAQAGKLDQLLFRNAERRQDVAQHDEGADQRRRAMLDFRPLNRRGDVARRYPEPGRQVVGGWRIAAEVDVVGRLHSQRMIRPNVTGLKPRPLRSFVTPALHRSISGAD